MKYIPHIIISVIVVALVVVFVIIYGSMTYLQSAVVLEHAEMMAELNSFSVIGNENTKSILESICRTNMTFKDESRNMFLNYNEYRFSVEDCNKSRLIELEYTYSNDEEYYILRDLSLYSALKDITTEFYNILKDKCSVEGMYFIDRTSDIIVSEHLRTLLGVALNSVSQFASRCEIFESDIIIKPINFTLDVNCTNIIIDALKNETPHLEDEIEFNNFAEKCMEPGFLENHLILKDLPFNETDRSILCNRMEDIFLELYNRVQDIESDTTISRFFKASFFAQLSSNFRYYYYEREFLDNCQPKFEEYFRKNYPGLFEES